MQLVDGPDHVVWVPGCNLFERQAPVLVNVRINYSFLRFTSYREGERERERESKASKLSFLASSMTHSM